MAQVLKIDGTTIKTPTSFEIERYNVTKAGRVSSGKMMMDLVAKKRKFIISYEVINGPDRDVILGLIDSDNLFFDLTYKENGTDVTKTVYGGAIRYTKFRSEGVWYWKDFSFDLIEQ